MIDRPRYGYARKGSLAVIQRSRKRGSKITLALCISMLPKNGSCVVCFAIYPQSMTCDKFLHFLDTIGQSLRTNSIVGEANSTQHYSIILDNGPFHGPPGQLANPNRPTPTFVKVQAKAAANFLELIYMRPLSPQFNPTEYVFSLIKRGVRKNCPSTQQQLVAIIEETIKNLQPSAINNTFKHCLEESEKEYQRISASLATTNPGLYDSLENSSHIENLQNGLDLNTELLNNEDELHEFSGNPEENLVAKHVTTGISKPAHLPVQPSQTSKMDHICGVNGCGEAFATSRQVSAHRELHRRVICNICGVEVISKHLNRHQKSQQCREGAANKEIFFPSIMSIFKSCGMHPSQIHYIEPIFEEFGIDCRDYRETIQVIQWEKDDRDLFTSKLKPEDYARITLMMSSFWSKINSLRALLDVPLAAIDTPTPPVSICFGLGR